MVRCGKRKKIWPCRAMFVLRTVDGLMNTSMMLNRDGNKSSPELKLLFSQLHSAVDLACEALAVMNDSYIDIEKGGNDDGRGKTGSGDN